MQHVPGRQAGRRATECARHAHVTGLQVAHQACRWQRVNKPSTGRSRAVQGLTRPRPLATCRAAAAARAPAPPPHGRTAASATGQPAQQAALAALLRTQHMPKHHTHTPPISRTCEWLRATLGRSTATAGIAHTSLRLLHQPFQSLSGAVSLLLPAVRTCITPWAQPLALRDLFQRRLQAAHVEAPQAGVTLQHRVASAAPAAGAHLQTHSRCTHMQHVATGSVINSAVACPSHHQASTSTPDTELQGGSRAWVLPAPAAPHIGLQTPAAPAAHLPCPTHPPACCRLPLLLTSQISSSSSESGSWKSSSCRYRSSPGSTTSSPHTTCHSGTSRFLPAAAPPPLGPRLAPPVLGVAAAAAAAPCCCRCCLLGVRSAAAAAATVADGALGGVATWVLLRVGRAVEPGVSALLLLPRLSFPKGVARLGLGVPAAAAVPVRVLRCGV